MNYVNVKVEFLNPFVHKCFSCVYIKMTNTLSAKYCQENKERLQNELAKDIRIYLKKKKKKQSAVMVMNLTENLPKDEK